MTAERIRVTDEVMEEIALHIGSYEPERGGALLGPVGVDAVTRFIPDADADVTVASYRSSAVLCRRVRQAEAANPLLEFKGIVHSHPGSLDQPSGQDEVAFADSLNLNPWMESFFAPIVVRRRPWRRHEANRLAFGSDCWMSMWVARREVGGRSRPVGVSVLPVHRDLRALTDAGLGSVVGPFLVEDEEGPKLAAQVKGVACDVTLVFPWSYPEEAPLALVSGSDGAEELAFEVDTASPLADVLAALVLSGDGRDEVDGSSVSSAASDTAPKEMFDRLGGVVPALADRTVLIAGVGSVGSHLAELLVRSGVGSVLLVDPDIVESPNLSRCTFTSADLGQLKVDALASRLSAICPAVKVATDARSVTDLRAEELAELVKAADLVVAATDDPAAQLRLNHHAFASGVVGVFPAVYARGRGGEVVTTVPGVTPCFRCATVGRAGRSGRPASDYGSGRLVAEPALGADVLHLTTSAAKLCLAALSAGHEGCDLERFLADALAVGSYLVLSTEPALDFLPQVFDGVAGQFAYQAVWLKPTWAEGCPVCGSEESLIEPALFDTMSPRLDQLELFDVGA